MTVATTTTTDRITYPTMTFLLEAIDGKNSALASQAVDALIKDPEINGLNIHSLVAAVDDFWRKKTEMWENKIPMLKNMDCVQRVEVVHYLRNGKRLEEVKD